MRFTPRGIALLFTRNADLIIDGKKAMSLTVFTEIITKKVHEQSVWKTSNLAPKRRMPTKSAIEHTAEFFKISEDDLRKKRPRKWLYPRMMCSVFLRREEYTLEAVAKLFDNMHYRNIIHYENQVKNFIKTDPEFKSIYEALLVHLNTKRPQR